MRTPFLILFICTMCCTILIGQKTLTTASGQKILLAADGSWNILTPGDEHDQEGTTSGTSLSAFEAPITGKYPLTPDQQRSVELLKGDALNTEAKARVEIEQMYQKMGTLELEKDLARKQKDKNLETSIKAKIEQLKSNIKTTEQKYDDSTKRIAKLNKLQNGSVKNAAKAIMEIDEDTNAAIAVSIPMSASPSKEVSAPKPSRTKPIKTISPGSYAKSISLQKKKKQNDSPCSIEFDGYDEAAGDKKRQVSPARFFGFTQPKLKSFFKEDDYVTCDASLMKVGKQYFISMSIRIKSKDASKSYGVIRQGETITFDLINGEKAYGNAIVTFSGELEAYSGHTVYRAIYVLDKFDLNLIKKEFVDKVGVMWSSGYESYPIYNVDFLKNQVECLQNN